MNKDAFQRMMAKMEDRFRELEGTFRDFERDFDKQFGSQFRGRFGTVPIDVEETDSSVIVRADLPGIDKDQIDVNVTENTISIKAKDEREVKEEGKNYVRKERSAQNYQRNLSLPASVDPDSAEATYTKGVLQITLSKTSSAQGSSVDVK